MIEEKNIIIEDREVFFLKRSAVSTPVARIVFIHGFPFSSSMWRSQMDVLPDGVEAFAFDVRGFGKSNTPHSFFSIDLFARDLFAFLDSQSIDQIIICGLSMGGYIALRAAQIDKERIAGIILCDTNCVADTDESKLKRFASIDSIISGKKEEFAAASLNNLFSDISFERNIPGINLIRNIILSTKDSTICGAQLALASRTDTSAVLEQLSVPALIIRGEQDKAMTVAHAEQLQKGLKGSQLVTVPQAGHMSNIENPDFFNEALLNFLSKHFS